MLSPCLFPLDLTLLGLRYTLADELEIRPYRLIRQYMALPEFQFLPLNTLCCPTVLSSKTTIIIYLIDDSRPPHQVPHWPAFSTWWSSRRNLVGPYQEKTDTVYITVDVACGMAGIPFYWIGPFVLWVARWLFPLPYICLIDNDCAPVALFEMQELDNLLLPLPTRDTLLTGGTPAAPGLLLVTEPNFELNAGMVIAAPAEHPSPLSAEGVADSASLVPNLVQGLLACCLQLLGTTQPPSNPTAAASSGLLLTPLLGSENAYIA